MSIAQLVSKIDKVKVYAEGSTVRRLASLSAIAGQVDNVTENIEVEIGGLPPSIINWVKQVGELLPNAYIPETLPLVGELDELETFVGSKKTKSGSILS
jgi:hypothetical protein